MTEHIPGHALTIIILGVVIVLTICVRSLSKRIKTPTLIGFIIMGFLIRLIDHHFHFLTDVSREILFFLADVGIITFLFRVGLESDIRGLLKQLKPASLVWAGGVIFTGGLGFVAARYVIHLELITSIILAVALTATSVGVSVSVWEEKDELNSSTGELLLDTAELDDISGVIFMAILFAIIPIFRNGERANLLPTLGKTAGLILLKLFLFGTLCALFSLYIEKRLVDFFRNIESPPKLMLLVIGIAFVMAALAGFLGFSVAIGAFFAGLAFSRDPESIKIDANFESIYDLFSPFFFIGIGLKIEPAALGEAVLMGLILIVVAIITKFLGHGLPALTEKTGIQAALVGVSLIPRAEIMMVIVEHGRNAGAWAVPPKVYAAMVLVTAGTCVISPFIVRHMLERWPQKKEQNRKGADNGE